MLRNYFLVALRNFWRNKTFTLIAVLTIASQSIRAATSNPVQSLKTE